MIGVEERPNEVWIVSKWMGNGALSEYLDQHLKDASLNRLQLVRPHIIQSTSPPLTKICVSSWTSARACSTCTRRGLPMATLNVYVCCISVPVRSCSELLPLIQGNIVIDEEGRANLYDFGSAILVYKLESINATTRFDCRGTILCMAPEVLDPEENGLQYSHASFEADIYALAMVMWQVCSNLHCSF